MNNALKACAMLSLCAAVSACAGNSPDGLASSLQTALTTGDVDSALALLDSPNIPSQQMFFYVHMLVDCTNGATCTTKAVPLTEEFNKRLASQKEQGFDFAAAPEGLVQISVTGEGMKGSTTVPYAKVGGSYKILGAHFSAQKIAELKAQTAQAKTDALLAAGVGFPPDPEWKTHATALPADGGEAGAALVSLVKARTDAVKAGDVEKRIAVGDERDAIIYAAKSRATGKENSLKSRQVDMRAQSMRELADVKVLGGYQNGDTAVLTVEGHDGHGWAVRGVQVMQQKNGKWTTAQADTVSFPAT
jgi:hypothetical protein